MNSDIAKSTIFIVAIQLNFVDFVSSLACYSCLALNYRQHVLARNEDLAPPQTKENLTSLFNSLTNTNIAHVEVSSSCADVALTSQPSFLNTPISICARNDRCVKIDFYYEGERVVLRNCLSNLMDNSHSKFRHFCQQWPDEYSDITVGNFRNMSVCTCQSDLCNSTYEIRTSFLRTQLIYKVELLFACVLFINGFFEFVLSDSVIISFMMFLMGGIFTILYLEFYFGTVYNCTALLHLHTLSSGFVALWCWFACLYPLLFMDILYTSSVEVRNTIYKYYACLVIFGSLLVTFAVSSYNREKEIHSVEISHLDHIRKLLVNAKETGRLVKSEAKKMNLKLKDDYSVS